VVEGRQRNGGFFSSMLRGVSNPRKGSKIPKFLYGTLRTLDSAYVRRAMI
jgi:hypothetical protein